MIDLNKEAGEFVLNNDFSKITNQNHLINRCFQYGANSKYVKQEILNFCIKELDYVKQQCYNTRQFKAELLLKNRIELLQKELKQLQDE
jgi:hypothetical protein